MDVKQNGSAKVKTRRMDEPHKKKAVPGFISRSLFFWTFPLFYNGNKRDLEEYDLVPTTHTYDSKVLGDKLERYWLKEERDAKEYGRIPSFTKALCNAFFWSFLPGGIMQFIFVMSRTLTPLLFAELLSYWSTDSQITRATAAYYALGMIIANWIGAYFNHHGNLFCNQFGMKLRVATSSLMFRKIMRMDNGSLGETTAGKVVNILSNDLYRFDLAFLFLHYVWIVPIQLAIVCYLGYLQVGYAAIIGVVALVIIALPIQAGVGNLIGKVRAKIAEKTDARIKIMSEVISGIQVIKMYAWEIPFEKVVDGKRAEELKEVSFSTRLRTVLIGFMLFTERAALFLTILMLIVFGDTLSATTIYPLQQYLNAAQINITLVLPLILSFAAELVVTLRRVNEFMVLRDRADLVARLVAPSSPSLFQNMSDSFRESDESFVKPISYQPKLDTPSYSEAVSEPKSKARRALSVPGSDTAIEVHDVSASWVGDPNFLALKKISLRLRKEKLCAVIGAVGSGKSSFLQLLLRELPAASGTVTVNGRISYAAQEAWLFPSTVRENILFGLPFDASKYKQVCKVCALEKDFRQFPFGDQTLVGERGVSLSGGQRARINLARAVYREADIYLLDDPLSAVDANVGRQLFDKCINGYLRGRTRILVTHQIHFLQAADFIIVLNEGVVENMGTFDELTQSGKEFTMLLSALDETKDRDSDSLSSSGSIEIKERTKRLRTISSTSETDDSPEFEAQVMAAEERESGNLKWEVVSAYFLSGNHWCFVLFTMIMILLTASAAAAADYWVSYWTNEIEAYETEIGMPMEPGMDVQVGLFTISQYLIIHAVIVGASIILTNVRVFPFAALCVSSCRKLHNMMFSNMLRGIMRFFDTSSSGRILNRFAKDVGALDEILPRALLDVLQIYTTLGAILILNAIALYWTLIPSLVLIILFVLLVKIYLKAAQGVKRLEGTTKSPVFGMVTSSLNGIATIRITGAQERLIDEFDRLQDVHTSAWNGYLGGGTSFGFYLDTLCLIYLTIVIAVFLFIDFGNAIAVGSVGLAVTQTNTLTVMLQHGARMLVEFLAQLTSVERVLEYTRIENEPHLFKGQKPTPPSWPSAGKIVFSNVNMRYCLDEAPVLKDLNIVIESGWKVGIVGRTGAGKSSLISAMFRFAYLEGMVVIDGLDTSLISKQDLRSRISIIPQEPVLFSATIRYNLDPFNIYSDDEIWTALEQVDMKGATPSLDFNVTEGGSNFSVGQRQLMCLARAVLRSNKILIMDEATANVDPQTDNFIQETIRRQFASCTVLTIAHRLNTIMDSDRVLVMEAGRAVEFDYPYALLSNSNSIFSSMVRETGENNSAQLFEVAKNAFFQSTVKEDSR